MADIVDILNVWILAFMLVGLVIGWGIWYCFLYQAYGERWGRQEEMTHG